MEGNYADCITVLKSFIKLHGESRIIKSNVLTVGEGRLEAQIN